MYVAEETSSASLFVSFSVQVKNRFTGKSVEVIAPGVANIVLNVNPQRAPCFAPECDGDAAIGKGRERESCVFVFVFNSSYLRRRLIAVLLSRAFHFPEG